MITASALTKTYKGFAAVDGISFEVAPGESFGLLGPNGAGKSTTMRMVGAVSTRTSGDLAILGLDPDQFGPEIRSQLGVVPQSDNLDMELRVRDNLIVYGRYFGLPRAQVAKRADELLEFAQLADRAKSKVDDLSGGMKRRLTIARALINDPRILLLDEPTTGLDPQARHILWDRLFRLKEQGTTLVLTTHYMDEAERLCDRVAVVDHGTVIALGTPKELIRRIGGEHVIDFSVPDSAALPADELNRLPTVSHVRESGGGSYSLSVAEPHLALPAVMNWLRDKQTDLLALTTRHTTLEDVFVTLTGRHLRDGE